MPQLTCRMKEYIQPFERQLALQELRALAKGPVVPVNGDDTTASVFAVPAGGNASALRDTLAYWHSIGDSVSGVTAQIRSEATLARARPNAADRALHTARKSSEPAKSPKRRCLRYATHGLHEYRGKFFPQLVRALMNIAQLPRDAVVLDPMCGSGTTLVEASLSGRTGFGLDMNPLSVFISDVKCRALSLAPDELTSAYAQLKKDLPAAPACGMPAQTALRPDGDLAYLERWFAPQTLVELNRIETAIRRLPGATLRDFYRVCLSNILRGVSWQKNDDLRIRREEKTLARGEACARFLAEAGRSTRVVAAFLSERKSAATGTHAVQEADARRAAETLPELAGRLDAVITSPPYATALPYLDTDRLSLIYLGLLPRREHRARDLRMVGNREVTERRRQEHWEFYQANRAQLPRDTQRLIERIDRLNKTEAAGFRRRNLPALLAKYFFDMREVLTGMAALLRPGGAMFLVVGNNRTTAGGELVEIRTANHLGQIASRLGFRKTGDMAMDMLVSRDIFRKNAVPSERILKLDAPQ